MVTQYLLEKDTTPLVKYPPTLQPPTPLSADAVQFLDAIVHLPGYVVPLNNSDNDAFRDACPLDTDRWRVAHNPRMSYDLSTLGPGEYMSDVCLRGKSSLFYEEGLSNLIVKLLKVPPRPPPGTERNKKSPTLSTRAAATHKDKVVPPSLKVIDDTSEAGPSLLLTKPWLLDIGASIGMHTLSAAKAGFPVIAIESSPDSVAHLRCSLGLNGLKSTILLNVGAGYPTNGDKLCVKSHDDTNNAAKNFVTPCSSSSTPPSKNDVKVPMLTLDHLYLSLVPSHLPPPTVVKLNVEGFEAWVLSGGENFVAKFRPPYFLLVANPFLLERAGGFWQHLLAFFYQHKYNVYSLGDPGKKITQFDYDEEEKNAALLNALGRCNYKLIIRRDDGVWPVSWPLSICDPS